MAAAMCFMRENTAKKLIIIKTAADNYEYSPLRQFIDIKDFSNEIPIYVNEKNYYWDIPLEKLCTDFILKKLKRLQLSGLKCLTVKKASRKLLKKERNILVGITHHTNVQIIVLQNDANVDKFAPKDYVYLDLSKLTLPDNCSAYREDYAWARVYLSAYGLHCINKSKGKSDELYSEAAKIFNNNKKKLAEKSDISLKEFTDKFVEQYFVTPSEAQKRKRERTLEAKRLKRKYNNLPDDEAERIITQELSYKPLYATYKEDFLMYAESYIKCSLSGKEAENMGISAKNMMKQLKNGGKYIYGELKPMYTGRKRGYGFQNLSLKKPWQSDLEEKDIDIPIQKSFNNTDCNGAEKMQKFAELLYKRINIS